MSITLALIPLALLLKVALCDKDFKDYVKKDLKVNECIILPTNFTNKEILLKTLNEYGITPICRENDDIVCNIDGCALSFSKEEMNYIIEIKNISMHEDLYEHFLNIDCEYKKNVQEYTYLKTVQNLKEKQITIESEEIMEDNSIVLTINLE
ncbi:hypothetical protein KTC96_06565 [Clostridium estertheticum]|uniref:hypothetical protein n=1 Tax=Clostridium estertheticum TaxID=238834 RepID=UPI001C7D9E30|nr:hypothetical protein [Clostridium estertheticum]MBX4261302.1 hypothetical protein [Clostridium estertheticum]WLC71659.1 hypothetical protein KTC96_06565 [Clostridium estertheticum]